MKVYTYIRVSGKSQVEGEGPDRQREACSTFARNYSLESEGEFFEKGVSGTIEAADRPEFASMLECIISRRLNKLPVVDGILVERLDRLARDLMVQEMLLKTCRENGIKVFVTDRDGLIDIAENDCDPTRTLIRQVMGALAQWEKSQIVLKLRKARRSVKVKTGRCEGAKPYGRNQDEKLVLKVVEAYAGGTPKEIAERLNEEGCRTRPGKAWTRKSVGKLLIRLEQRKEENNGRTIQSV